tara:strand:+ start:909 stop:1355 length:447 start_codon:yes stop_codon:yes gene_type:complete
MSKNLYEAALLQLKGRALESYATLDILLKNPTGIPDHMNWVDEIIKHANSLSQNENAIIKLQQYFGKRFQEPPPSPDGEQPSPDSVLKDAIRQKMKARSGPQWKLAGSTKVPVELYPEAAETSGLKEGPPEEQKKKRARKPKAKKDKD